MNRPLPERRSIRLQGYDYSGEGLYFVTICVQDMKCLLGKVMDKNDIKTVENVRAGFYSAQDSHHPFIQLSETGEIIHKEWLDLRTRFVNIELHEFVIMPNHVHETSEITQSVGANNYSPDKTRFKSPSKTIGYVIRGFKIGVTKWFRNNKRTKNFSSLQKPNSIRQRNYYEHIIRNSTSYTKIAEYIQSNPENRATDNYYVN